MRKEFIYEPKEEDDDEPFLDIDIDFDNIDIKKLSEEERQTFFAYFIDKVKKQLTTREKKMLKKMVREYKKDVNPHASGFELFALCNYWVNKNGYPIIKTPDEFLEFALSHPELFED